MFVSKLALALHAVGISFAFSGSSGDGVVRMPMRRVVTTHQRLPKARRLGQPQSAKQLHLNDTKPFAANTTAQLSEIFYTLQIRIGFPPQTVQINFDTGSSETWVNPYCDGYSDYEPALENLCRCFGIFLAEQSESVIDLNGTYIPRTITYGSGAALVHYLQDDVSFSENFTIKRATFGAAEWSFNMPTGILGAAMGKGYNQDYPSFIDEMYEQGMIEDKDFSVALGSVSNEHGEVIFGGIDTGKFTGPLKGVPMTSQLSDREDAYFRYWINLTHLSITEPESCSPSPITNASFSPLRVLVDTGTTLTYLPYAIIQKILPYFPDYIYGFEGYEVPCSYMDQAGTVNFGFGDIIISVLYKDFIFKSPPLEEFNFTTRCYLGIYAGYGDFYVLGDTFLRAAYVTFRQQTQTIYLAQGADCESNIRSSHGNLEGIVGDCDALLGGYGSLSSCPWPPETSVPSLSSVSTHSYHSGDFTSSRKTSRIRSSSTDSQARKPVSTALRSHHKPTSTTSCDVDTTESAASSGYESETSDSWSESTMSLTYETDTDSTISWSYWTDTGASSWYGESTETSSDYPAITAKTTYRLSKSKHPASTSLIGEHFL